jgi:hypothetical protein
LKDWIPDRRPTFSKQFGNLDSTYATISKRGRDWIMYLLENIDEKISQYEEKMCLVKEAIILSQSKCIKQIKKS